jgi:hypothetical protein
MSRISRSKNTTQVFFSGKGQLNGKVPSRGDLVRPSSNHSNHAILMECHNIIMVVYQTVLEKWSIDFANDNDWSNFVTI